MAVTKNLSSKGLIMETNYTDFELKEALKGLDNVAASCGKVYINTRYPRETATEEIRKYLKNRGFVNYIRVQYR